MTPYAPGGGRNFAIAKLAPCGSETTVMRPTPGMSIGGTHVLPPIAVSFACEASTSSTAKYVSQCDGAPAPGGIGIMPAIMFLPSVHCVYGPMALAVSCACQPNSPP